MSRDRFEVRLDRWLSRLQVSPRSQRVLFETSLDWQHEVAMAKTTGDRFVAHARMSMALLRACLLVGGEFLATAAAWPWLLRIALSTAIISWLSWERLVRVSSGTHGDPMALFLALWPQWISMMPSTFGLTVLTGPSRAKSPALGLAVVAVLMAIVFAWLWPILLTQQWLVAGRPAPETLNLLPARDAALLAALPVGLVLLADRVRVAPQRLWVTAAVLASLLLAVWSLPLLQWVLNQTPWADLPAARRSVLGLYVGAVPFILWFMLVRRQEPHEPNEPHEPHERFAQRL